MTIPPTPPAQQDTPESEQDSTIKISKSDLRDAVGQHKQKHQTGELPHDDRLTMPFSGSLPYGLHSRGISEYKVLPSENAGSGPRWLISLNGLGTEKAAVGIEVA